ncbi:expressed unknown protein [Seminavis robusta]|uniref:VWFD domain-containing protein n=1 Tax=Seminavis robusta TaxID=568900 RepID=A0A9N8H402_9STRA|nr:expressed unknown protein [Seminavis robusta]|eukprot:Sro38_g023610.1 n/a (892) ;mRNA; f:37765-40632
MGIFRFYAVRALTLLLSALSVAAASDTGATGTGAAGASASTTISKEQKAALPAAGTCMLKTNYEANQQEKNTREEAQKLPDQCMPMYVPGLSPGEDALAQACFTYVQQDGTLKVHMKANDDGLVLDDTLFWAGFDLSKLPLAAGTKDYTPDFGSSVFSSYHHHHSDQTGSTGTSSTGSTLEFTHNKLPKLPSCIEQDFPIYISVRSQVGKAKLKKRYPTRLTLKPERPHYTTKVTVRCACADSDKNQELSQEEARRRAMGYYNPEYGSTTGDKDKAAGESDQARDLRGNFGDTRGYPVAVSDEAQTTNHEDCPAAQPPIDSVCSFGAKECAYGTEICCDGSKYDSFVAKCIDGVVQGFNTDACMTVVCPIKLAVGGKDPEPTEPNEPGRDFPGFPNPPGGDYTADDGGAPDQVYPFPPDIFTGDGNETGLGDYTDGWNVTGPGNYTFGGNGTGGPPDVVVDITHPYGNLGDEFLGQGNGAPPFGGSNPGDPDIGVDITHPYGNPGDEFGPGQGTPGPPGAPPPGGTNPGGPDIGVDITHAYGNPGEESPQGGATGTPPDGVPSDLSPEVFENMFQGVIDDINGTDAAGQGFPNPFGPGGPNPPAGGIPGNPFGPGGVQELPGFPGGDYTADGNGTSGIPGNPFGPGPGGDYTADGNGTGPAFPGAPPPGGSNPVDPDMVVDITHPYGNPPGQGGPFPGPPNGPSGADNSTGSISLNLECGKTKCFPMQPGPEGSVPAKVCLKLDGSTLNVTIRAGPLVALIMNEFWLGNFSGKDGIDDVPLVDGNLDFGKIEKYNGDMSGEATAGWLVDITGYCLDGLHAHHVAAVCHSLVEGFDANGNLDEAASQSLFAAMKDNPNVNAPWFGWLDLEIPCDCGTNGESSRRLRGGGGSK